MYEWMGFSCPAKGWRYQRETMQKLHDEGRISYPTKKDGSFDLTKRPSLKRYLDEQDGSIVTNIWTDVENLHSAASETLGYPTQKPLALLERIIAASSNEGDVVLDPFCGCGTAVHAAQKLNRQWIGIDITHLAISLIEKRLRDAFKTGLEFETHGTPKDLDAARDLATRDKYQFQWWAVSLVEAQPFQGKKKGADGGIDGLKFFGDIPLTPSLSPSDGERVAKPGEGPRASIHKIVVSVKGGGIKADDVRSLMAVREREGAEIALFISMEEPTRGMIADAASAGFYESATGKKYPRVQLLTIEGLLSGKQRAEHPDHAPDLNFKKARAESNAAQKDLI
jgi:site-specific DNA-methyltransferase (adenine-specific)